MLFAGPRIFYIAFVPVAKDTFSSISDTKYPTLQSQYVVRAVQVQLYRDRFVAGPRIFYIAFVPVAKNTFSSIRKK